MNAPKEIIIRTKRINSYFSGEIKSGYFPLDGNKFYVSCVTYSGGRKKQYSILDVIEFKADTETQILKQVKTFVKKHNLVLEFPKQEVKPLKGKKALSVTSEKWKQMSAQENISRLPEKCLGILPATGEVIWIVAGELGYYPISQVKQDEIRLVKKNKEQTNSEFVDMMNARDGITKSERTAMEWGSMFGWGHGLAMPEHYDLKGNIIKEFTN